VVQKKQNKPARGVKATPEAPKESATKPDIKHPRDKKLHPQSTENLRILPLKDGMEEAKEFIQKGEHKFTPIALTYHGKPGAVILSVAHWQEMIAVFNRYQQELAIFDKMKKEHKDKAMDNLVKLVPGGALPKGGKVK